MLNYPGTLSFHVIDIRLMREVLCNIPSTVGEISAWVILSELSTI